MANYQHVKIPHDGEKIRIVNNKLKVPANPIIAFIEGDGTGQIFGEHLREYLMRQLKKHLMERKNFINGNLCR